MQDDHQGRHVYIIRSLTELPNIVRMTRILNSFNHKLEISEEKVHVLSFLAYTVQQI